MIEGKPELFTCEGKGGVYELVGTATGAGTSSDQYVKVYRCMISGRLFFRTAYDFSTRMQKLERVDIPTKGWRIVEGFGIVK